MTMELVKRYSFPALMAALNLGAAVTSFLAGDWRRGTYFIASAVCIVMVTAS